MRCRLCLTELPQGQIVCPICGLDNSSYYQEEVKKKWKIKKQSLIISKSSNTICRIKTRTYINTYHTKSGTGKYTYQSVCGNK